MDSEPPQPPLILLVSLLPALLAAAYATITACTSSLSTARRTALKDSLQGGSQAALERYLQAPARLEARWLWLRVLGIASTAALCTEFFLPRGSWAWLWGLSCSLLAYGIPSEIIRPFAVSHADTWLPNLLRLLRPLEWLIAPLSDPLSALAQTLASKDPPRIPSSSLTETEVEWIVNEGEQNGSLAHDQSEMIRNVLDFGELTAEDVMVPRMQVDAIEVNTALSDVLQLINTTQHSRYPVYDTHIDNIIGVLHVKDLFSHFSQGSSSTHKELREFLRVPVAFVPDGQPASIVLRDMRAGRHHLAVVVDEFGGFSGILTLEDLLEEIVGDIQDEHDLEDDARIVYLDADSALVDASLPVTDVNRSLGTQLPEGDYLSLGGLLVEHWGEVPSVGSQQELLGLAFVIREADRRRIARVEIRGLLSLPSSSDSQIEALKQKSDRPLAASAEDA